MFYTVNKMVTLGTAFGDIEDELEDMLDLVAEALDLIDEKKSKEAEKILMDLENKLLDFLDYEEVDENSEEMKIIEEAVKPKAAAKDQQNRPNPRLQQNLSPTLSPRLLPKHQQNSPNLRLQQNPNLMLSPKPIQNQKLTPAHGERPFLIIDG